MDLSYPVTDRPKEGIALWRRGLAVALGLAVWVVSLAALHPGLHELLHGGHACAEDSLCAVAQFGSGLLVAAATEACLPAPPREPGAILAAAESSLAAERVPGLPPARGPPPSFLMDS